MKKINYTFEELKDDCKSLANDLRGNAIENIYGISRGGLIPAILLSHLLKKPLILDLKDCNQGTLIIDDISDSGKTLKKIEKKLKFKPLTATMWLDKDTKYLPTFWVKVKTKKEWVVFPWELLKAKTKKDN